MNLRYVLAKMLEWRSESSEMFVLSTRLFFLRLSLLWGFSEDVLYLDSYAMLFCFFEYGYICVLHSIFFEIFVSEIIYFIHRILVIVQSVWHSLSLRNNPLVLARQIAVFSLLSEAIWL